MAILEDGGVFMKTENTDVLEHFEIKILGWPKSSLEVFHHLSELFGKFSICLLSNLRECFPEVILDARGCERKHQY